MMAASRVTTGLTSPVAASEATMHRVTPGVTPGVVPGVTSPVAVPETALHNGHNGDTTTTLPPTGHTPAATTEVVPSNGQMYGGRQLTSADVTAITEAGSKGGVFMVGYYFLSNLRQC